MKTDGPFLYPNVTSVPKPADADSARRSQSGKPVESGEFDRALKDAARDQALKTDLQQVKAPLKFSTHASERLRDRKIPIDQELMSRVSAAVDKAEAKGVEEALVLTDDAAFIVGVKNRTVITAMDRGSLNGNVFTNIDGAVIA